MSNKTGTVLFHRDQSTQAGVAMILITQLKTHRRLTDVNVTIQMWLNIRPAVAGVTKSYLVEETPGCSCQVQSRTLPLRCQDSLNQILPVKALQNKTPQMRRVVLTKGVYGKMSVHGCRSVTSKHITSTVKMLFQ